MANKSGLSIDEIKEVLQREYNRDNFVYVTSNNILEGFVENIREIKIESKNSYFKTVYELGHSSVFDVSVFEVELKENVANKKVSITQEMFNILKSHMISNAIVSFVNADRKNFRYSLLTIKYETMNGKIIKIVSNPKRYSYLLGFNTKPKTAFDYLLNTPKAQSLQELMLKFSVEAVNKEFYSRISDLYLRVVKENNKELKIHSLAGSSKYNEFVVRLIGRIIFCWFLKEKKSKNGVPLIPNEILSIDTIKKSTNYYHDVLEPLFFELLNTNHKNRKDKYGNLKIYKQVPYLNGGLFKPYESDYYKYDSSNESGAYGVVMIDNQWFIDLYDVLNSYNFTVDENTAYDIELSIDPEMLGRIFENLLAEINPETGDSARKNTGSFYTPREIVDFMVDSSILEYLKIKTNIEEERLYNLIKWTKSDEYKLDFNIEEKEQIIDALYNVRTIDIACGSGAFPIGLLQKIVFILEQIDEDAKLWFDKTISDIKDTLIRNEIRKKFDSGALNYIRKLKVIQNSIFGVDVQNIAVEIARLRAFLSLVIEENVSDSDENRGVKPLPSLEFKFITANSLIKLPDNSGKLQSKKSKKNAPLKNDISYLENDFAGQNDFIEQLKEVIVDYFSAEANERLELKERFRYIQNKMLLHTQNNQGASTKKFFTLCSWEPFENEPARWFDQSWMFGVEDGFDIVIGNPPYVQLQKSIDDKKTKCGDLYKDEGFNTFEKTGDLYCLFYEKGLSLLREKGILTFITSNKWMRAGYGNKLRNYLANNSNPVLLLDFGGNKVFKSATVDVNIMILQKSENSNKTIACTLSSDADDVNLKEYVDENSSKISFNTEAAWIISSDIETNIKRKIEEIGTPLKDWDINIYRGILTGCNEAFIISGEKRAELIKEDPKSAEIIRPILRGRDIKRYGYEFNNLYLICTFPSKHYDIDKYPAIKNYLLTFGKEKLEQTGKTYIKNGVKIHSRKKTNNEWFETQDSIAYSDLFLEQKIVYPCIMSKGPAYTIDTKGEFYVIAPGNIITGKNLIYLNDCLNSKIFYFALRKFYMGGGIEGELKTNRLLILPIPLTKKDCNIDDEILKLKLSLSDKEMDYINTEYQKYL